MPTPRRALSEVDADALEHLPLMVSREDLYRWKEEAVLWPPQRPQKPIIERLLTSMVVDPESGCWRSTRTHNNSGYASINLYEGGESMLVHRLAHAIWIGSIPAGYHVDHVARRGCVHRDCFNPDHLEAVPPSENNRRAWEDRTHCQRGHLFRVNVNGKLRCPTCRSLSVAQRRRA